MQVIEERKIRIAAGVPGFDPDAAESASHGGPSIVNDVVDFDAGQSLCVKARGECRIKIECV